jgi:hypothetical protein
MTKRLIAVSLALGGLALWYFVRLAGPAPQKIVHGPSPQIPSKVVRTAPVPGLNGGSVAIGPVERMHAMLKELRASFHFGKVRQKALRALMGELTEAELLAALNETFSAESDNDMTHVLLEQLASMNAAAALDFARAHQFGESPPWWMSVIGGLKDPQQALPDLLKLPPGDARTSFLAYLTGRWALSEPDAALDYAVRGAPIEAQQLAISNAVLFAARKNPRHAFELALAITPESNDVSLVAQIVTDWAGNDYPQASERIRRLPEGAGKQSALAGLVAVTISRDLPRAWPMIPEITDQSIRTEFYVQAARQWLVQDATAARTWLANTTELSTEQKTTLLHEGQSGTPVSLK